MLFSQSVSSASINKVRGSGFMVLGSRLSDLRIATRFITLKVLNERTDLGAGQARLFIQRHELRFGDVLSIERDVKLALHFGAGAFGVVEKAGEFGVAASIEAFGDVV